MQLSIVFQQIVLVRSQPGVLRWYVAHGVDVGIEIKALQVLTPGEIDASWGTCSFIPLYQADRSTQGRVTQHKVHHKVFHTSNFKLFNFQLKHRKHCSDLGRGR